MDVGRTMHTSEVEKLLRSEGSSPGREWPPRSEAAERRAEAYRLRVQQGISHAAIARRLGVTRQAVSKMLKEGGN